MFHFKGSVPVLKDLVCQIFVLLSVIILNFIITIKMQILLKKGRKIPARIEKFARAGAVRI